MKILFKILFYLILLAVMSFMLLYLFFQQEYNKIKEEYFPSVVETEVVSNKTLTIAYASGYISLNPVLNNPNVRARTLNIYESLVQTNRDLIVEPGLALSWGRLKDDVWEFNLRSGVKFHDGSDFDADDVLASIKLAMESPETQLKDVFNTIERIEKIDDLKVVIYTNQPDPILVNRLVTLLIFPSESSNFDIPIGTGAYKYVSENETDLVLDRFEDYWGDKPYFKNVILQTIENRFSRLDAVKEGKVGILANVPPTFAEELEEFPTVSVLSRPSLEVNFLIFNYESEILKDKRMREAIAYAFDKSAFVQFSNGYATPSNQFISNGIFGYNPEIIASEQDLESAKSIVKNYDPFKRPSVNIDLVLGAEVIGEFIKLQLNEIGISANLNYLTFENLQKKIKSKESEIYLLGWRSEIGDASGFYENIVYSKGALNGSNFSNKKVDQLIELSLTNLDQEKRLAQFQEIMKIITEEEFIGVPLFEADVIYGITVGIHFHPRLDGYILAKEISTI